mgnify:FL=1
MKKSIVIIITSLCLSLLGLLTTANADSLQNLTISCPKMNILQQVKLSPDKVTGSSDLFWLVTSDLPASVGKNSYYPVVIIPGNLAKDAAAAYQEALNALKNTAPDAEVDRIVGNDTKFGICFYQGTLVSAWGGAAPSLAKYQSIR